MRCGSRSTPEPSLSSPSPRVNITAVAPRSTHSTAPIGLTVSPSVQYTLSASLLALDVLCGSDLADIPIKVPPRFAIMLSYQTTKTHVCTMIVQLTNWNRPMGPRRTRTQEINLLSHGALPPLRIPSSSISLAYVYYYFLLSLLYHRHSLLLLSPFAPTSTVRFRIIVCTPFAQSMFPSKTN